MTIKKETFLKCWGEKNQPKILYRAKICPSKQIEGKIKTSSDEQNLKEIKANLPALPEILKEAIRKKEKGARCKSGFTSRNEKHWQ